ncbi:MAG: hypothetical protein CMP22_07710 [Rickettsiales bacterium]|nr:hypothetical protein [Rickettsiales bacterium]|tara:strand:- start:498 stop:749 length:252 start_codon:yes stop_codon:yes gene_type:complete
MKIENLEQLETAIKQLNKFYEMLKEALLNYTIWSASKSKDVCLTYELQFYQSQIALLKKIYIRILDEIYMLSLPQEKEVLRVV